MKVDSRARRAFSGALGALCLALTLALTSTGVQIARAEDPPALVPEAVGPSSVDPALADRAAQSAQAPVCSAGSAALDAPERRAQLLEQTLRLKREIARRAVREPGVTPSSEEVIVLNGRGYRYGN